VEYQDYFRDAKLAQSCSQQTTLVPFFPEVCKWEAATGGITQRLSASYREQPQAQQTARSLTVMCTLMVNLNVRLWNGMVGCVCGTQA